MARELTDQRTGNRSSRPLERFMNKFERVVITALELLIVLTVAVGTVKLFAIFIDAMPTQIPEIDSPETLQPVLRDAYGGVLMVLLGLELLQTLKTCFSEHHLQMEMILVVAMIAVGRHIIHVDIGHMPGTELGGLALLITSLAVSYYLVKRAHIVLPLAGPPRGATDEPTDA
jgi:uncharacterized membrane protein (DUF373 family)